MPPEVCKRAVPALRNDIGGVRLVLSTDGAGSPGQECHVTTVT
jgi:hypothetical protein